MDGGDQERHPAGTRVHRRCSNTSSHGEVLPHAAHLRGAGRGAAGAAGLGAGGARPLPPLPLMVRTKEGEEEKEGSARLSPGCPVLLPLRRRCPLRAAPVVSVISGSSQEAIGLLLHHHTQKDARLLFLPGTVIT